MLLLLLSMALLALGSAQGINDATSILATDFTFQREHALSSLGERQREREKPTPPEQGK
ncbi:unnamed protein product [Nyctereutes procyonoides]|uniref:(raccoon dog) hypothetical protein n=1 Tax=Nyctereutes procyonoides TaxID=34880 RepID=A0A811YZ51_NYCPR|nr:unnamed protein product [Nyctereutes procyonoides]CAD7681425.1 unnamed protein product [Nyctereutes procyonoides]